MVIVALTRCEFNFTVPHIFKRTFLSKIARIPFGWERLGLVVWLLETRMINLGMILGYPTVCSLGAVKSPGRERGHSGD